MNDLVTTVRCPRCNGPAAVGWSWSEDPPGARAVEFVCPSGCRLTPGELADRFPEMHGRLQHPAPIGTAGPWPDAEAVGPCPTPRATTEPAIWARRRYLIGLGRPAAGSAGRPRARPLRGGRENPDHPAASGSAPLSGDSAGGPVPAVDPCRKLGTDTVTQSGSPRGPSSPELGSRTP